MKLNDQPGPLTVAAVGGYMRFFRDRADAGARLAEHLSAHSPRNPLVLGLARGGVPVAAQVALGLEGELDVVVARKIGAPSSAELALGAVTADVGFYVNKPLMRELAIPTAYVERVSEMEAAEARRQERRLRTHAMPNVAGRTVYLVDDGLATGATMIAAARSVKVRGPARIVVAAPVGSAEAHAELRGEVDEVVCLVIPQPFWAVGLHYQDSTQVTDEEVLRILAEVRGLF